MELMHDAEGVKCRRLAAEERDRMTHPLQACVSAPVLCWEEGTKVVDSLPSGVD